MAKHRLKKFRGKIIGITGSVGKSSTKEAIFTVLNTRFKVKKTKKNMNSDFGLLLTVLDIESGFNSATKWSWYLIRAFFNCIARDHSEVLLLELGVDKKGDMDFLTSVVHPDIAVITQIAPVHMEKGQFASVEEIFEEKIKLLKGLRQHGISVLNTDNEYIKNYRKKHGGKHVITYGLGRACLATAPHLSSDTEADFWGSQIRESLEGQDFVLHYDNHRYEVHADIVGGCQIYALIPAVVCGVIMGMSVEECVEAIKKYSLPPGRMSVIPAMDGATILDSSYNSSPEALRQALITLKNVGEASSRRKIAVLGSMNELGEQSKTMHKEIGETIPGFADILFTVGTEAVNFASGAKAKGMSEDSIFSFKNSRDAAEFLKDRVKKGDLILVKGSQNNVRLELLIKEVMKNPEEAKELLVRQDGPWTAKL